MIMGRLVEAVIFQMESAEIINKDDEEIYRFGLECFFLKVIHYLSYLFISLILHMTIPVMVSAVVLVPLRSRAGGYHANTRFGCYLFSCSMVFLLCFLNNIMFSVQWFWGIGVIDNVVIGCFSPVENDNRILEQSEQRVFKGQALLLLGVIDILIIFVAVINLEISKWLLNGLLITAILIVLGRLKNLVCIQGS